MKRSMFSVAIMMIFTCSLFLGVNTSRADLIWDLTYEIPSFAVVPSYGTVTISESSNNSNAITLSLNLTNDSMKIQQIVLNYNDSTFNNDFTFFYGGSSTVNILDDENNISADGSSSFGGYFDLQIPNTGNIGFGDFITDITAKDGSNISFDLNAAMFNFMDTSDTMHVAVHIGEINEAGDSIWVTDGNVPVPEPGTMLLLGSGLIGLAGWGRKKFRK